jgi:hypothetical protein
MSFQGQINFGYPLVAGNIIENIPNNAVIPLSIGNSLQGNTLGVTFADLKSSILSGTSWGSIIGNINLQTDLISLFGTKQNTLVSGSNIKTVNGNSLVGSGGISLTKTDIGLPNVNDTSDINKPISTATQTALNAKADLIGGLVPITQIPPAAIERLVIVTDQAARFALTTASVQNGDTVKQSDTGEFYYVIDQTNLNNASGYAVYTAGTASSVAWSGITGVPTPVSTLSGTNTGDETVTTIKSKLGITTLSGSNTGDQDLSGYAPLTPRVQTVASSATVTPVSTNDIVTITAQAVGLTLANPTGTFSEGQSLMIRIKDNGTARTIAFDTNYRAIGITLPTTTVISKTMYLGIIYNSTDAKWDILGLNQQA